MGVEPTLDDAGRPATVLKTAETTGPPPLPWWPAPRPAGSCMGIIYHQGTKTPGCMGNWRLRGESAGLIGGGGERLREAIWESIT
jgi:hypothetical protein